jgi:hypothetical protein
MQSYKKYISKCSELLHNTIREQQKLLSELKCTKLHQLLKDKVSDSSEEDDDE